MRSDDPRHGFLITAGHELLQKVHDERPEPYGRIEQHEGNYLCADSEGSHGGRLTATGTGAAGIDVREEILADFAGDAEAKAAWLDRFAGKAP